MKLYKQTAVVRDSAGAAQETHWSGSQAEASKQRAEWTRKGVKRAEITTDEVDVPTDKKGLLEWLNNGGA